MQNPCIFQIFVVPLQTKMKKYAQVILLSLFFVLPMAAQTDDLCLDGTLLFREDFGGNDPDDPTVSTTPVPGMSSRYIQVTNLETKSNDQDMYEGRYLVTKQGYRNSFNANYSVWHIMDDHTYPDDMTRGYMLEIDATGGNDPFYVTTLSGLCAGMKLSFTAYVVNLTTAGQYNAWRGKRAYAHPKLSFVITNPDTNEEIARAITDTIAHDWSLFGVSNPWQYSAHWQLVGTTFEVPAGVDNVTLSIYNSAEGGTGNDFAMDDIEVRLCLPVSVMSESPVCRKESHTMTAVLEDASALTSPEYRWEYSADGSSWGILPGENAQTLTINKVAKTDEGWYRVTVANAGNMDSQNCRATSEPFRLVTKECGVPPVEPAELCTDGTLLFREDFGGNDPSDPRVGIDPVVGMTYEQLLSDAWQVMHSGAYLITKSGYCNGDTSLTNLPENRRSQWHLQDDHTYPDDRTRGYLMEIDARGDNAKFYQTTITDLCPGLRLTFSAYVANVMTWGQYVGSPGKYAYPRLLFTLTDPTTGDELVPAYDTGDIPYDETFEGDYSCWQYSAKWNHVGMNFTVPDGVDEVTLTIYNNVTSSIGNDFALDDIEIRLCLPVSLKSASPVCLKESHTMTAELEDASALTSPEYRWEYSADGNSWAILAGESAKTLTIDEVAKTDEGWYRVTVANAGNLDSKNCRATSEPVQLVTKECEVPPVDPPVDPPVEPTCPTILVNKYDWVLLVDNVTVRELYPDRQVVSYRWFKDDELIEDATEDDYSEESILHGVYQVFLTLDDSTEVCSNIIDLRSTVVPAVTTVRAYNSSGVLLGTWQTANPEERPQLPAGIYLLLIDQGDNVYSEKVFVP